MMFKNARAMRFTPYGWFMLAVILFAGPTYVLTQPSVEADSSPPATVVNYYELPKSVTDARDACYRTAAEDRGIPTERNAYITWWNANEGTAAEVEWTAAFERCTDGNPMPGGKWNFAGMTLVKVEVWP
jgi:hypothetical protein